MTLADNIAILAVQYTFSVIFLNIHVSKPGHSQPGFSCFQALRVFMCYSDLCLWMQAYPDRAALALVILTIMGVTALWWLDEGE